MAIQPYVMAYLKEKGITINEFKGLDYIIWIDSKHDEFQKKNRYLDLQNSTPQYVEKFIKFLNGERGE